MVPYSVGAFGAVRGGVCVVADVAAYSASGTPNVMLLRAKGVRVATMALWLAEHPDRVIYGHADPALKDSDRADRATRSHARRSPPDELLAFLQAL